MADGVHAISNSTHPAHRKDGALAAVWNCIRATPEVARWAEWQTLLRECRVADDVHVRLSEGCRVCGTRLGASYLQMYSVGRLGIRLCQDHADALLESLMAESPEMVEMWQRKQRGTVGNPESTSSRVKDLYFARSLLSGDDGPIKIGVSSNVPARMRDLKAEALLVLKGGQLIESQLHQRFGHARRVGEWFEPVPELLALIDEQRAKQEARAA